MLQPNVEKIVRRVLLVAIILAIVGAFALGVAVHRIVWP